MSELVDSGVRKSFETGAEREIIDGKGRCDLLPSNITVIMNYVREEITNIKIMESSGEYNGDIIDSMSALLDDNGINCYSIYKALGRFCCYVGWNEYDMVLNVAKQFEDGARKYSPNNWKKGLPTHCYLDSAIRHLIKYMRGDQDEPHDRAFAWNLVCLHWTTYNKPELVDHVTCDSIPKEVVMERMDKK